MIERQPRKVVVDCQKFLASATSSSHKLYIDPRIC